MWKDFIKGMKMLKYGDKPKWNMVFGGLFLVSGLVSLFTDRFISLGCSYVPLGISIYFSFMVASLEYSNLIASSPARYALAVRFHDIGTMLSGVLSYLLVTLILWLRMRSSVMGELEYGWYLLYLICFIFCLQLYMGIVYKLFGVAVICLVVVLEVQTLGNFWWERYIFGVFRIEEVMLLGLVLVIAGGVLSSLLRRLVYKRPLSRWAAGTEIRKTM